MAKRLKVGDTITIQGQQGTVTARRKDKVYYKLSDNTRGSARR